MAMMQATLIEKKEIATYIYELHYQISEEKTMKAGQFITFILPGVGGRSYSVLELKGNIAILIVKRWGEDNGGRGGSIVLCDAQIGEEFKCVGPVGHFVLTEKNTSRLFLGTGTGFVPLYSQILGTLNSGDTSNIHFAFGVRTQEDVFYIQELQELSEKHSNFSYTLYLSREETSESTKGYVTDSITSESIQNFEEYYMCGAPAMIESCQKNLQELGVSEDCVFFEKY